MLRERGRKLRQESLTLYYVARDPATPLVAKLVAGMVVAYAFSPIDLIPDFIPIVGYLDDLLLIPAGIWLALKLTPRHVLAEARTKARKEAEKPVSRTAAAVIVLIWLALAGIAGWWLYRALNP